MHAAAGGVGQAAVQLARLRGAEVFATVGSETKRQLVRELFHLTDDHIFNSRDESFADDVLLNSLSGELLRRLWECIAPVGRFVDIGKADIIANNTLSMGPFDHNVTFSAVDLVVVHEEAKLLMKKILQDVVRLFEENSELCFASRGRCMSFCRLSLRRRCGIFRWGRIRARLLLISPQRMR